MEEIPSELSEATGEVDEDKIDQLLHLLHEADPTGERGDDPSLPVLEGALFLSCSLEFCGI